MTWAGLLQALPESGVGRGQPWVTLLDHITWLELEGSPGLSLVDQGSQAHLTSPYLSEGRGGGDEFGEGSGVCMSLSILRRRARERSQKEAGSPGSRWLV